MKIANSNVVRNNKAALKARKKRGEARPEEGEERCKAVERGEEKREEGSR